MAVPLDVNGVSISYPQTNDVGWANDATNFAIQTAGAFQKLGLSTGTTVDIPGTLDVTGNTTLDANLSVVGNSTMTGNLTVNGNTTLGNAGTDTIVVTGILNADSGVLYVDPANNRVGINDTTPSEALDVTGNVAISGNETVGGTLGVTGNTTLSGTLAVTGASTFTGQALASDGTALLPGISFSGDTNTGLFRSAADQVDIVTNGDSRFRIEATGQIKAVYESTVGTNYRTTLHNGYLCRAWVNFDGTGTPAIRASGNVSSITDNGVGRYQCNFTTAMPDVNYAVTSIGSHVPLVNVYGVTLKDGSVSVNSFELNFFTFGGSDSDVPTASAGVFR